MPPLGRGRLQLGFRRSALLGRLVHLPIERRVSLILPVRDDFLKVGGELGEMRAHLGWPRLRGSDDRFRVALAAVLFLLGDLIFIRAVAFAIALVFLGLRLGALFGRLLGLGVAPVCVPVVGIPVGRLARLTLRLLQQRLEGGYGGFPAIMGGRGAGAAIVIHSLSPFLRRMARSWASISASATEPSSITLRSRSRNALAARSIR